MSYQAGLGRVTLLLVAIAQSGAAQYIPLKASEFLTRAPSLVGQNVEVFGNFVVPFSIEPGGSPGWFSEYEGGGGTPLGDVVFDKANQAVVRWMVDNCKQTCNRVFVRGKVVLPDRFARTPVLQMTEISYESKTGGRTAASDLADKIAALERAGAAKPLLPAHAILPKSSVAGPLPPPAATNDSTKSTQRLKPGVSREMWQSMVNRADSLGARANDEALLIIPGPERPANFETSYRSIRNTGLWMLFEPFPYQDMTTLWPRVAIVVQEKPEFRTFRGDNPDAAYAERLIRMIDAKLRQGTLPSQFFANGQPATDYCWRLWAKVWTSPAHSEDIAPFNWCYSETHFNESLSPAATWGAKRPTNMHLNHVSTGATRTTGPVPPETPLPPAYLGLYSPITPMAGSLLLDMGFDPDMSDGRVWFLEDSTSYARQERTPTPAPTNNVVTAPVAAAAPAPKAPETARAFAAIVADVRRGQIMITVGGSDGVSVDDEYPILRREGAKVTQVGTIKITEVENASATGTLTSGEARFYDCVRACPPPRAITQSSPQEAAKVVPLALAPTAFSLQGTEHLRYDVTMTVASMTQSGFYEVDASPAEAGRIAVRIQGKFGGQEYSSTITLAPKDPIPLDQLAQLGPIAVVLLQLQAYSLASAFKVESTCQYAGLQGRREVVRQGNQIVMERCVSPDVGFPLAMIVSPYAITLTQFRK